MDKLSHYPEQKYKGVGIMNEKIGDMEDRAKKSNVNIRGSEGEKGMVWGRILKYVLEENFPGLKNDLHFHINRLTKCQADLIRKGEKPI